MNNISPKENFLNILRHKSPQWIPWVPLIDKANTPSFVPKEMKDNWDMLSVSLYLRESLDCDILIGAGIVAKKYRTASGRKWIEGDKTISEYEIAGRKLRSVSREMNNNGQISSAIIEYLIKDEEDLLTLEMLLDDTYLEYNLAEFERLSKGIGDMGIVSVMAPRTPVMELIIDKMGGENFAYATCDCPELLDRIIYKMDAINEKIYRMIAESDLDYDVVRMHEDQDSLLTSPTTYRDYILPMMKKYCNICQEAGKIFMMHACGHVNQFLDMILETGIDVHHYLTDKPVGDTPPSEARHIWGDKITIMAAVDPFLQPMGTVEQVKDNVMDILRQMQPGDNFILMSPLKPDIPEENIRIIQKIMKEYAKYPMNLNRYINRTNTFTFEKY